MAGDLNHYKFISKLKNLEYVDEVWLFGSRARGDNESRSDIDLAVICPKASDSEWSRIMDLVEEADTLLEIDCLRFEKSRVSPEMYANVMRDKKVL